MKSETRSPVCFVAVALALLNTVCLIIPARGDEKPGDDPYASVWESLSELIRKREYGTAASLLDSLADDPEFREHGAQIRADKETIAGLQALEQVVYEQAAHLPAGTKLDIYGIECTLLRYEENPKGDELILRSQVSGKEQRRRVSELPSSTWMHLSESKLDAVKHRNLILGIFLGFDRSPDVKAARKLLNDAGSQGEDVTQWLARLEDAADRKDSGDGKRREQKADADPIVGHWQIAVKLKGFDMIFRSEFRVDGTNVSTMSSPTLLELRRRKWPLPRSNPSRGKWTKNEDATYRVTLSGGATLHLQQVGERLLGKTAAGHRVVGLRQVAN